ncbi:GntR family transcriptional regulator [Microbacterium soli]|uniref:GntR family transcriptional regulator n=1 Tax=Microbacterium soli TaxID=446075 RepID=A0ABP7MKH8_9MICO
MESMVYVAQPSPFQDEGVSPLANQTYVWLADAIVRGELQPGSHVSEPWISTKLGISRSPVREALLSLLDAGVLTRERGRGFRVAEADPQSACEFYDCRILIEPECARLAGPHIDDEVVATAQRAFDEMAAAQERHAYGDRLNASENFHRAYRAVCPNRHLVQIVNRTAARGLQLRAFGISRPGTLEQSLEQHRLILDAFRAREPFHTLVEDVLRFSKERVLFTLTAREHDRPAERKGPTHD